MAIHTRGRVLISTRCLQHATHDDDHPGQWRASWLPGKALTKDQATTALVCAEEALKDEPHLRLVRTHCIELGLNATVPHSVVTRIREREEELATGLEAAATAGGGDDA